MSIFIQRLKNKNKLALGNRMKVIRFKQLTLSLCLIITSSITMAEPILVKKESQVEEYQLNNGFRVILAPNEKENKVFMNTIYLTGSLNDPQGKGGLAHLLEHLAFKGTTELQEQEFQRRLNQYTLSNNASTDYYSTRYTNIVRPEKNAINQMIYLESQRMNHLVLQEKYIPTEINIVKREREVRMDQPFAILMDQIWKSIYGNYYLGRLPIGDLAELQSIRLPELEQFYRTWYTPNNAMMVVTGKFDRAEVLSQIDQHFSPIASRPVPAQVVVPRLNLKQMPQRQFEIEKGSQSILFNVYLEPADEKNRTALSLSPLLYTMQPSGRLYQDLVETAQVTNVSSTTLLDKNFNLVFMGAVYAPQHQVANIEKKLIQDVESNKNFDQLQLNRVKKIAENAQDNLWSNSTALGSVLSDYLVENQGNWTQIFQDQQQLRQLSLSQLNQQLQQFLKPENRIQGHILPTPEAQKIALSAKNDTNEAKTLDQVEVKEPPIKDLKVYEQELTQYLQRSKQNLQQIESKIQRGELQNGMKYALFPVATRDNKIYATIQVNFGTAQSLFNKTQLIDFMSYLLLRASEQYDLQTIADRSIQADGSASAVENGNGVNIYISAKKDQFDDFFKFIVEVLKQPKFEQTQFDLIKSQTLSTLDRTYTEPEIVAQLTLARLVEQFEEGDLRYHFEPEVAKKQIQQASNDQVKALYQQFFTFNHAQIAITGDFKSDKMRQFLQKEFAHSKNQLQYSPLNSPYQKLAAKKVHVLAEQREFGSYMSVLNFPIGVDHADAPAMIVLEQILGGSQLSSRLAKELREKNALVYGFNSNLSLSEQEDSGALVIGAKYSAGRSEQVSQAVHQVFNQLLKNGVTEQEVAAAKNEIMKKRVTTLEDERRIHAMLPYQLERNKNMQDRLQRDQAFAKLSKKDIDRVIGKYLNLNQFVEVAADQYGQAQ